jgi:hypothetical protein
VGLELQNSVLTEPNPQALRLQTDATQSYDTL